MFHVKHRRLPTPRSSAGGLRAGPASRARAYAELLATEGVVRGLIGPREVPAAVGPAPGQLRPARPAGPRGRPGGRPRAPAPGCPGWCWRSRAPTCGVTLVEPMAAPDRLPRRGVRAAGPGRGSTVVRGRAEECDRRRRFDVVTVPGPRARCRSCWRGAMPAGGAGRRGAGDEGVVGSRRDRGGRARSCAGGGAERRGGDVVRGPGVVHHDGGPGGPGPRRGIGWARRATARRRRRGRMREPGLGR